VIGTRCRFDAARHVPDVRPRPLNSWRIGRPAEPSRLTGESAHRRSPQAEDPKANFARGEAEDGHLPQ
jgi:hypothetical protein